MNVWILTSENEEWGRGSTRKEAIDNAINGRDAALCDGEEMKVDFDTIMERLQYGTGNGGLDLYESEEAL